MEADPAGTWPCPRCDAPVPGAPPAAIDRCEACGESLVVAGRFRLTGLVGEGAQGRVYRAQALVGGAAVAVKQPRLPQTDGWRSREVADQGQRLLAGVQHPALPIFHHHERLPDGRLVLVRELLEGGSLAERIGEQGARPSAEQVEGLLRDLLELLEFLHTRVPPVIHRDIKPANVLFRSPTSWAPVLVDFDTVAAPDKPSRRAYIPTALNSNMKTPLISPASRKAFTARRATDAAWSTGYR